MPRPPASNVTAALSYSGIFFFHFVGLGFAWITLFTQMREALGVANGSMVMLGVSAASIFVFGLFTLLDWRGIHLPERAWLVAAELGLAAAYYFLAIKLKDDSIKQVPLPWLMVGFFGLGCLQSSFMNMLNHLTLTHGRERKRFPLHRAMGSLGYVCAGVALGFIVPTEYALFASAAMTAWCALLALVADLHDRVPRHEEPVAASGGMAIPFHFRLVLLFVTYHLCAITDCLYQLYAHETATTVAGERGVLLIPAAVVVEIVVLVAAPKLPHRFAVWLIPMGPFAWTVAMAGLIATVNVSPWFLGVMLFQGFNCPFQSLVNVSVKERLRHLSAQAGLTAAQSAGAIIGHGINASLPAGDPVARWRLGFVFALVCLIMLATDAIYRRGAKA